MPCTSRPQTTRRELRRGVPRQRLGKTTAREVTATCVRTYRESMAEFSELKTLELWYQTLPAEELIGALPPKLRKRG